MTNIYDYIFKENIVSKVECEWILEESLTAEWSRHKWTKNDGKGNFDSFDSREETELSVAFIKQGSDLRRILEKNVKAAIGLYAERFPKVGVKNHSIPRLNRYSENTKMSNHVDHIHSVFDGKIRGIPIISIVGVLNDDYEGGEFIFNNEYEVKFNAGDILIFPSVFLYAHKVKSVKSGTRTSFVSWGY